jgi:Flp pilus assembly protein TadG
MRHFNWALLRADASGVALIEFAICATLFLTILAGVVDIGRVLWTTAQLDAAVSAGAQYAANNAARVASDPSGLATDIGNVVANLNGSNWATATIAVNNNDSTGCYCPSGSPGNWSWGAAKTCASACSAGGGIAGQFVTISASRPISPIFSSFGFVGNGSISRDALVQTQ